MNKFKNALLAALGISLVALTLSVTGAGRAVAQSTFSLVKVINTSSEPVPTTITNSPTVKVSTSTGNPLSVRSVNDGVIPFQQSVSSTFLSGSQSGSAIFAVPSGTRLIIEYVSAQVVLPSGQNLSQVTVATNIKGNTVQHTLVRHDQGPHLSTSNNLFVVGQPLRLYADEGTPVIFSLARSSPLNSAGFIVTVSGYLIDTP